MCLKIKNKDTYIIRYLDKTKILLQLLLLLHFRYLNNCAFIFDCLSFCMIEKYDKKVVTYKTYKTKNILPNCLAYLYD